jgi:hypothetical protein
MTLALASAWLAPGASLFHQKTLAQDASRQTSVETQKPKETPVPKNTKDLNAEQVAELVIYASGLTRERIAQIQRSGVERGRITRLNAEGRNEELTYERRFMRGETSEKDKIRLDQKMPTMEYSLVYSDGRVWGIINGTPFTPRQEAIADFLSGRQHSIGALLRYREDGATLNFVGKEKQKNIEMWVIDLVDKEKQRTRYYVSTQKWRVLWLEYEETPPGATKPVQFRRTFHDYRYAQGQLYPYRSVLYADGKQTEETNVSIVTFGLKLDDSVFQSAEAASTSSGF